MKDTTTLSLGRETILSFMSKFVMAAIGFGGTIVFARILGPDGLGVYKTAVAAAFVVAQIPAGTGTAIKKRISEVDVRPSEFLGVGLLFHGAFSVLVFVGYLSFRPIVDGYFASPALAAGAVTIVFALGLFEIANSMYSGLGYPAMSTWIDTLRSLLTLAFQLVFIFRGYGALGLVVGFVLATAVSGGVSLLIAGVFPEIPGRRTIERVYSFARWSVSNGLLRVGYGRADILLINAFVGSGAVGFYSAASQLTMPGAMFGGSIQDSLAVKSSGLSSVGKDFRADMENAMSYVGLIALPIFFGALSIPTELMATIFGASFASASAALVGMTAYQALHVYRLPFEAVAEGTDNPDLIFRTNVLVFVVYAPLALLFGSQFGLLGVIGASIFGEAARIAVYQIVARRWVGGVLLPRPVLEQIVSAVLMFATISFVVSNVFAVKNWLHLAAIVGGGASVYFTMLFAISQHFRHTVLVTVDDTFGVDLTQ
jgi:O-antigen/teichoic acid export membrane protein